MKNIKDIGSLRGMWEVTTEGDCEGRSTTRLGIYVGWLDEIALHLANKSYYSLHFKRVEPIQNIEYVPTKKKVAVSLDIGFGTWDMGHKELAHFMQTRFLDEGRDVTVEPGGTYAGFTLVSAQETAEDRKERLKREAREKLEATMTKEELRILGL